MTEKTTKGDVIRLPMCRNVFTGFVNDKSSSENRHLKYAVVSHFVSALQFKLCRHLNLEV